VNEDSTSYSVSIFSAEEQALLKSGSFEVHCDLSFRLQRDDSASSSSFTYLDLDTNTVHTQRMQGGYQDHQRFEMPSCSEITCHKSQWSSCPWTSKNAILLAVDFRPRSGHAHASDWNRNKFTFTGTHYYVTQVSYDYVEVQNHHGCIEGGNLGNIGRPTAQGIQKDARCEFVKLLNAFGNGCSHDLDVACPEGSNYDPQTVLCGGACDVACESICKESCDDSDVCVAFAIHGRYGPQMYDQRGVSCSDNQHGLTPSGGWTAFVKQLPTQSPTQMPTVDPSKAPTPSPTDAPSASPSIAPTPSPTDAPSASPSKEPTSSPTDAPSSQPTITYPYPRSGTLGVASTNEWNFVNEDSTSYSVSIFSAEEQALLKSGSFEVHCDLSFRLQRDDSASSSSFTYLDLDTNTVHTQRMQGGYQDHQRFEMPSCSEITCHKSQWSSCPWTSKNAILLAVDFRPRSGHAHASDWNRNKFTFTGTHYYVTQVSYDYVEVQNHHGCIEGGNLGNIGRPTAQGIQKDARCEFVKLLNAFGNGCSHDLDVACPEGSNYDPQTALCGGVCGVACESICKESCDDSDVCVAFAIHGRYGPQMYDQRGVSCSDNQHGLTPSGGWTAFVKQVPTQSPTQSPSASPSKQPTTSPTSVPTSSPTDAPSASPSKAPTPSPTDAPSASPSKAPTTDAPSASPSKEPTTSPTTVPTSSPTDAPSQSPSFAPSTGPTAEEFILKVKGFHGDASKALSDEAYAQKRVYADKINFTLNRLKSAEARKETEDEAEVASEQSARAVPPANAMTYDDGQSEIAFDG